MHPETIGPYRIERELGRGGMGEVFLATDSRLERNVAIKALPSHLSQDADRLARFQREAKVLASLSHPGIGAIYGLEEAAGHQYLILEYIEGETLADRLVSGAIPVDETIAIAKQIAEALEVAHEKGVIHRDLKPANVMLTSDGHAKVLDFGLARTADGAPSTTNAPAVPNSPTIPIHSPTVPGVIMGTAGYMSPEQARGKPVDKRSDIFSFGCVLFEMLTGAGPFPGETATDSMGAILHREPEWALLPAQTPARVVEVLRNCLAKDRRNRLHDIADARLAFEHAIAGREWTATARAGTRKGPLVPVVAAVAGVALLGAGWLIATLTARTAPVAAAQAYHVSAATLAKPELSAVMGIAPDAKFVVYQAWPQLDAESTTPFGVLVVRRLDRTETKVLDGTEGIISAALSGDGRSIAFVAAKDRARTKIALKKMTLDDGRPVGSAETLCELPSTVAGGVSLCWSSDREIVVAVGWQQTILAVSSAGGEPRVVLREEQLKEIDNWGEIRPLVPGKSILASRWVLAGQSVKERTEVVELATGKRTPLLPNAGGTLLVAEGMIVARRGQNTLIAARLDMKTLQIVGEPVTVWSGSSAGSYFVAGNGVLAMTTGASDVTGRRLAWIDEQGQSLPVGVPARAYGAIKISPDGGRVVSNLESADLNELPSDLWIQDLSRRTLSRLPTQGPSWEFVWSRDGKRISHGVVSAEAFTIWDRSADGSGEAVKLYSSPSAQVMTWPADWSPDGKVLAVMQVDLTMQAADVLMLEKDAGGEKWVATPYLNSAAGEDAPRFSPDGKWIRFVSDETGQRELYVQRFTGAAAGAEDAKSGRRQISTGGAWNSGWWSADGKEVRYIDNDSQLVSVQIQTEPTFTVSLPKVLASIKELKTRDVTFAPDGRLMVVLQGENERPSKIDLVVNFIEEVKSKLAARP